MKTAAKPKKAPVFLNPAYKKAYESLVSLGKRLEKAPREEQLDFIRKIGGGKYIVNSKAE